MTRSTQPRNPLVSAVRAAAGLLLAGGALGLAIVILPPASEGSAPVIVVVAAIAIATGLVLTRVRSQLPEPVLGALTLLGTVLITVATYQTGGAGSQDNEILYLWVTLFAFYFLSFRHAIAQLVVVAGAYAGVLLDAADPEVVVTRWLVTTTALTVAGIAIAWLRDSQRELVIALGERARQDALTGLLNRTALTERAGLELARAEREDAPVSAVTADIDGFKEINDTLGHPAGDEVLRRVASVLERSTRVVDAITRVGGDEFVLVLPGAGPEEAQVIAERVRAGTRREFERWRSPVTLSLGVATAPPAERDLEPLWRFADEAMYRAKRAGGDRVRVATAATPASRDSGRDSKSGPGVPMSG